MCCSGNFRHVMVDFDWMTRAVQWYHRQVCSPSSHCRGKLMEYWGSTEADGHLLRHSLFVHICVCVCVCARACVCAVWGVYRILSHLPVSECVCMSECLRVSLLFQMAWFFLVKCVSILLLLIFVIQLLSLIATVKTKHLIAVSVYAAHTHI